MDVPTNGLYSFAFANFPNFRYYISLVFVWTENYLIAAAFTALTFLVCPYLRRFGAGRESDFVYHRAGILLPSAVFLEIAVSLTAVSFK